MKRAFIIGISGQDGAYLSKLLLEKGYELHGSSRDHLSNPFENLMELGIKDQLNLRTVNILDCENIEKAFSEIQPDEIYNFAGQSSVWKSFEDPKGTYESIALATVNILECLRNHHPDVKFFNASSSECFGDAMGTANETTYLAPLNPYAVAKTSAYWSTLNYRRIYGLHLSSGILFNHESPLRSLDFVTRKIIHAATKASKGDKTPLYLGTTEIQRDWGWAPDYVEAMWCMLQQEKPNDYVIATGQLHSLEDFLEMAFGYFGLNWRMYVKIESNFSRPTETSSIYGDASKAKKVLGWEPSVKFDEIVAEMAKAEIDRLADSREL